MKKEGGAGSGDKASRQLLRYGGGDQVKEDGATVSLVADYNHRHQKEARGGHSL